MPEILRGYKIVGLSPNGDLVSWLCRGTDIEVVPKSPFVRYHVDGWTRPKKGCGPLCVFETAADAFLLAGNTRHLLGPAKVFECVYIAASKTSCIWGVDKQIWPLTSIFPGGTELARCVSLVKEVAPVEEA